MYDAKIVADSISPEGKRLRTFQLVYPRYIHAEFMTHRVFSRNASSSRAVPVAKSIAIDEIVEPIRWGKNQPGMQAADQDLSPEDAAKAKEIWRSMSEACKVGAAELARLGLHKQWANRPLEWFSNIRVVMSATEMDNFYELRDHKDAQPEIQHLARLMKAAEAHSTPRPLAYGEWHLPYIHPNENLPPELALKCSVARCARVSYLNHDGTQPSATEDMALFDRLLAARPLHASPAEHQATPSLTGNANFTGWKQFRRILEEEHVL